MIWVLVKVVSCLIVALISAPGAGAGRGGEEERASCRGNQAAGGAAAGMTSDTAYHRCSAGNWATQTTSQTGIRTLKMLMVDVEALLI